LSHRDFGAAKFTEEIIIGVDIVAPYSEEAFGAFTGKKGAGRV
jgi:hypothetical protein